jgi:hypothetical protein
VIWPKRPSLMSFCLRGSNKNDDGSSTAQHRLGQYNPPRQESGQRPQKEGSTTVTGQRTAAHRPQQNIWPDSQAAPQPQPVEVRSEACALHLKPAISPLWRQHTWCQASPCTHGCKTSRTHCGFWWTLPCPCAHHPYCHYPQLMLHQNRPLGHPQGCLPAALQHLQPSKLHHVTSMLHHVNCYALHAAPKA